MRAQLAVLFAALAIPAVTRAAEMAHNENFIVLAPDQAVAAAVLAQAERFRDEVAREWLGEPLPPSVGRATINIELTEGENRAFTWPAGGPDRKYHKVWLTASRAEAVGSTLRHEVAHLVLHTRYPGELPAWADEGIASLYDDPSRVETRRSIIAWYAKAGNWPELAGILSAVQIPADDQAAYSVAASLTAYLLSRGNKATLIAFAIAGKQDGWDRALAEYYGIVNVAELDRAWWRWAAEQGPFRPGALSARDNRYGTTTQSSSGS